MTKAEDELRLRPSAGRRGGETPEEKRIRYAHNADTEADLAEGRARAARRGVRMNRSAALNARRRGELEAAALYAEMADAGLDLAEAHEDYAKAARAVARYYGRTA